MLLLSFGLNVALALALIVIIARMRSKIVYEKLSTYAGCLRAATSGLAIEDVNRRFDAVGYGFASLLRSTDEGGEAVRRYITRAALLRVFRKTTLADVSEHVMLLALETAGFDDGEGDQILAHISHAGADEQEPRAIWKDGGIAAAQFVAERKVLDIYRTQLASIPLKLLA